MQMETGAMGVVLAETETRFNLQGQVRHQTLPITGVEVRLYPVLPGQGWPSEHPIKRAVTGSKGDFCFVVQPGTYRMEAIPTGSSRYLKTMTNEVKVTGKTTFNISLSTGALLSGQVALKGGKKVTRCEVLALGIEPSSYRSVSRLDDSGRYSLVLPKGKYHIASRCSDNEQMNGTSKRAKNGVGKLSYLSTAVSVVSLNGDQSFDLALPAMVRLSGEIADAGGLPVAEARIVVRPTETLDDMIVREMDLHATTRSDQEGRFEVLVEPGTYDINIVPSDPSMHFCLSETGMRVKSDTFRRFDLEQGHTLKGQVQFEAKPLSQCLIRVQDTGSEREYMTRSDESGAFSIGVPAGTYKIIAIAHPKDAPTVKVDGVNHTGIAPFSKTVVVGGDTHVAVRLKKGTAVSGKVTDDSGQSRAGVRVSLFPDGESAEALSGERLSRAITHCATDANGRYSLFVAPGTYWLVVHKDFDNAVKLEVPQGKQPIEQDITWHGWCQVRFEVTGEDGKAVPRCQIRYSPYGQSDEIEDTGEPEDKTGEKVEKGKASGDEARVVDAPAASMPSGYVMTSDQGQCQVTLPAGVYAFYFHPPDAGSYQPRHIRQLSISADLTRKVSLQLKQSH